MTEDLFAKSSSLRGRTMKLLKWGPSRVRVKSAKAPLTSYVEDPRAQDLYATHDAAPVRVTSRHGQHPSLISSSTALFSKGKGHGSGFKILGSRRGAARSAQRPASCDGCSHSMPSIARLISLFGRDVRCIPWQP